MTDEETFKTVLFETLEDVDEHLATSDLPVAQRPFHAARIFSEIHITEVQEGGRKWKPDFTSTEFVTEGWFKSVFADTYEWYTSRYPNDFNRSSVRKIKALVLIYNTPFLVEVPASISQPGRPGETIWVAFPDTVLAEENPLDWIVSPPNLTDMEPRDREKVRQVTTEIASSVRQVSSMISGIGDSDSVIRGFTRSILVHLETAVDLVVKKGQRGGTAKAFWELQLACEHAFKAVLQKKSGEYPKIHNLFFLYDQCDAASLGLDRRLIENMPRESEVMELRHGQAPDPPVKRFFECYRAVFAILPPVIEPLVEWRLGKARFELAQPPWMEKVRFKKS
ncbi:MAG: hypothetical protein GTO51_00595 [Candidatus Latescibacteria bacterium]|nr:hypothetical protein [Candidatus Latescibacterota bacterium]NIM64480.1 hypothetical protein [Candidatus Latescibacterota bacterium]NIO00633.1 hypothetical protein [Candidatus Latescibacterota bacterium]NIO27036.1 hypothetical protein [Candidatus Latescibacterota bacterium]NIO54560.1 hypothetical protein [Candidatus Latescibacterota bacterium]